MSGSNLERLCEEVSEELQKVDEWMRVNKLSLNVEKNMLFTHSRVDRNAVIVRLGNKVITQVKSVKILGIHIDDWLNYNDQTCVLSKKLSRVISIMFKLSAFVPPYIIRIIYFSLFYSHLIYGMSVWGGCGVSNINKIIKLQNRAISLCANNHLRNSLLQYPSVYSYFTLIKLKNIYPSSPQSILYQ